MIGQIISSVRSMITGNDPDEELDSALMELRQNGRPQGQLMDAIGKQALEAGRPWPVVLEDNKLQVTTVPQTFEGLLAFVTSWDSLLLDEQYEAFRAVVDQMVPMGLKYQPAARNRMIRSQQEWDYMKENHPEDFDRMQGWKV